MMGTTFFATDSIGIIVCVVVAICIGLALFVVGCFPRQWLEEANGPLDRFIVDKGAFDEGQDSEENQEEEE